jgi:hypothetical protein
MPRARWDALVRGDKCPHYLSESEYDERVRQITAALQEVRQE